MVRCNLQITLAPNGGFLTGSLLGATHYSFHRIFAALCSCCIYVVRNVQWLAVHLRTVAVEVILHIVVFLAHDTPRAVHSTGGLDGH